LLGLIPIFLIAFTLLAFTFVGDGLRDALDPNSKT
jgi:ABC-type dipeptide/oligopeptide/nickel transport system permease subunit